MLLGSPPLDSTHYNPTLLSFSDVSGIVNTLSDVFLQVSVTRGTPGNHETHLKHHAKDLFRRLSSQELKHDSLFSEVHIAVNESLRNQKLWSESAYIKCCCLPSYRVIFSLISVHLLQLILQSLSNWNNHTCSRHSILNGTEKQIALVLATMSYSVQ